MFRSNIALRGGIALVRAYIPELMEDVLLGLLDPSGVLGLTIGLDGVPEGYVRRDGRETRRQGDGQGPPAR